MPEKILANAHMMTPEGIKPGHLTMMEGRIKNIGSGSLPRGYEDMEGDYLMPGLVELHTDNLEKHLMPRPEVYWPEPGAALEAHDAQMTAAGITTVFDSICVGEPTDKGRRVMLNLSMRALREAESLRAHHLVHLRCEVSDPEMWQMFEEVADTPGLGLVSLMDHTPGQRQWRDVATYKNYYRKQVNDEEFNKLAAELAEQRDRFAPEQSAKVVRFCLERNLPLASHDDADCGHIEEALRNGVCISEFPTTLEAAQAASHAGLSVIMGAPNIVRGGSHSGNVSALEVAQNAVLDCLSSDYVPSGLLYGAWLLHQKAGWSLPEALKTVTENPAAAVGLSDRGRLAPGLRADLIRVKAADRRPVVRSVWVQGRQVF